MLDYKLVLLFLCSISAVIADEVLGCGGFVRSHVPIDFSKVIIKLYTKQGILKDEANCAPNNGYYFIPIYEKGDYKLQLESPLGWTFDPTTVNVVIDGRTDLCSQSQDINFIFKGFGIAGKVNSVGNDRGPAGITVELVSSKSEIRTTATTTDGSFFFTLVYPGEYLIKISHPVWRMSKDSIKIHVSESDTHLPGNSLTVAGYDVNGFATNQNVPLADVQVLLYSQDKKAKDVEVNNCKTTNIGPSSNQAFLCYVLSDENGRFTFPTVPSGNYVLLPQFEGKNTYFSPKSIDFSVLDGTVDIAQPFQVVGFSTVGRVLEYENGKTLSGAKILLNNEYIATTSTEGMYNLERITAGSHHLSVVHDDFEFETYELRLTPKSSSIPDMFPSKYKVCGKVSSDISQSIAITKLGSTNHMTIASEVGFGTFCIFLPQGKYQFEILNNKEDIQFYPRTQIVEVTTRQVSDLSFTQLKATLRGLVRCYSDRDCANIKVILRSTSKDNHQDEEVREQLHNGSYVFSNIRPGTYRVFLTSNRLCWQAEEQDIIVSSFEYTIPDFVQSGYSISFVSSHDAQVEYQTGGDDKRLVTLTITPSQSTRHCLPSAGTYHFAPRRSCHSFEPSRLIYATADDSNELTFNARTHRVSARIRCASADLGPLTVDVTRAGAAEAVLRQRLTYGGPTVGGYEIALQLVPGEEATFTPVSDVLLFTPALYKITGGTDCAELGDVMVTRRGRVFTGRMHTALAAVRVSLTDSSTGDQWTTETDAQGHYRFSPVPDDSGRVYALAAALDSYVFTGPDADGNFIVHKLAEMVVRLTDVATKLPLQGALVSLSGGENYRRNLQTNDEGIARFQSLSPSDYFLRPMMKEYSFDPASKMISVVEGATDNIQFTGKRVAHSAYGSVTSLNNDPEGNVVVIATGLGNCTQYSEETTSESDGSFRIRGLTSFCSYELQLHKTTQGNPIERSTPSNVILKIQSFDVHGIKLIAFRTVANTDVLVQVYTRNPEHYRGAVVKVASGLSGSTIVHSSRLESNVADMQHNNGFLTYVKSIPLDHGTYLLYLESPFLAGAAASQVQHIVANASFVFVRLTLLVGQETMVHESTAKPTSLYTLLFIMLIGYLVYNADRLLQYAGVNVHTILSGLNKNKTISGKQNPEVASADTTDIDQIVQSINATKRTMKPKKI